MGLFSRHGYRLLKPRGVFRKLMLKEVAIPLLFGIVLGIIIGHISFSVSTDDAEQMHVKVNFHNEEFNNSSLFVLRCVIMLNPSAKKLSSFLMAIRDTYGSMCNQTIYYTNDKKLYRQVKDLNIVYLDNSQNSYDWDYFSMIAQKSSQPPAAWTIFLDEQNALFVGNLRKAVLNFNHQEPLILARIVKDMSISNYIFPFWNRVRIPIQGGVLMTASAISALRSCTDGFWPRYTESSLYSCAQQKNITLIDPIDEEGMHLFNYMNFKTVVSAAYQAKNKGNKLGFDCCSDHALTFGQLTHKEIRMAFYTSSKLKIFGKSKDVEYVDDDYGYPPKTTTKPTTKNPTTKKMSIINKINPSTGKKSNDTLLSGLGMLNDTKGDIDNIKADILN